MSTLRGPGHPEPDLCLPYSSVEGSGNTESNDWNPGLSVPGTRSSLLAQRVLRLRGPVTRRKREATPPDKKDANYWKKRHRNNEAAKRSREKRRLAGLRLEGQLLTLADENAQLRAQMLSLRHRSSLSAQKCKASCVEASALFPAPAPAFFQPGLWRVEGRRTASALAISQQQESAIHPFQMMSCFGSPQGTGGFDLHSSHSCSTQPGPLPLPGPGIRDPFAIMESRGSAEADMYAQQRVSCSGDDIATATNPFSHPAPSMRPILPTPDDLHHAPIFSYLPPSLLVPNLNHPIVGLCNNFLLPWGSSYPIPPAVDPGLPHTRETWTLTGHMVEWKTVQATFNAALPYKM